MDAAEHLLSKQWTLTTYLTSSPFALLNARIMFAAVMIYEVLGGDDGLSAIYHSAVSFRTYSRKQYNVKEQTLVLANT